MAPSQSTGDLLSRERKSEAIPFREYKMRVGFASGGERCTGKYRTHCREEVTARIVKARAAISALL
jgi:hypothetical protein